jgi:hypothetical protein
MSENIEDLWNSAQDDGALSDQSASVLAVDDIGERIQNGLGVDVDDVRPNSEVVLVSQLIDDSASIRFAGNSQVVRDGHNLVIKALSDSGQSGDILGHTRYLNGTILNPFMPLEGMTDMDGNNYDANGGTPLYEESVVMLGTVLAKVQEFANAGVPCRTVSLIMTDGGSTDWNTRADAVETLVQDMLRSEIHIVAGMGIDDGSTDFREVFRSMGIRDEWILTPGNSESEIRAAFQTFSQSAVTASQTADAFDPDLGGGFAGASSDLLIDSSGLTS